MEAFLAAYGLFALAATLFVIGLVAVSFESVFLGVVAVIAVVFAYNGLAGGAVWAWLTANPYNALYAFLGYVAAGVVWSFAKWMFHVWREKDRYVEVKEEFLAHHNISDAEWRALESTDGQKYESIRRAIMSGFGMKGLPKASQHKARIIAWMMWWPASAVWTLIDDPLRRLFNWIYARVSSVYDKITKMIFGGHERDFVQTTAFKEERDPETRRAKGLYIS